MTANRIFETIVGITHALIIVLDADGRIVLFNQACERVSGYRFEEVEGRLVWDFLLLQEETAGVKTIIENLGAGQFPNQHKNHWISKAGELRLIEWSNSAVTDESSRVTRIIGTGIDVTERERAEQALYEKQQRQRVLLDNIPDAVWLKDSEGRYSEVNQHFRDNLEDNAPDPIGKTAFDIFPAALARARTKENTELMRSRQPLLTQKTRVIKGKITHLDVIKIPLIDATGNVTGIAGLARDVTSHKLAEQKLRLAHQWQKALLDSIPDAAWLKDSAGHYLEVNQNWLARHNRERDDIIGKTFQEIFPGRNYQVIIEEDRQILNSKRTLHSERPQTQNVATGDERWLDVTKTPVLDEFGNVIGIAGVTRDITERHRAENLLHLTLQRQKALLDNMPDAAWLKDDAGRYIEVNQNFLQRNEVALSDVIGKIATDFRPSQHAEKTLTEDREVMITGHPLSIERHISSPGKETWLEIVKAPIVDKQGKVTGLVGVSHDVTLRKRAEQSLHNTLHSQKALLNSIPDAAWLKDSTGRYIEVNQNWLARHLCERAEIIGKTDRDIFPGQNNHAVILEDRQVLNNRQTFQVERLQYRSTATGKERWLEVTKTPAVDEHGNVIGIAGVSRDITDRKLAEHARLKRDAELRTTLIREVNHRIKNNLQSVMALLLQHAASHPETAAAIQKAVGRLNTIAMVHGMHGGETSQEVSLRNIIDALATSMWGLHSGTPIHVQAGDDFAPVQIINSESVPVALIINELIQNAVKHSPATGPDKPVRIRLEHSSPAIRISISNHGAALPAGFDYAKGTKLGTGLSLLKSLMPATGADISFQNSVHAGVTVTLTLSPPIVMETDRLQNCVEATYYE